MLLLSSFLLNAQKDKGTIKLLNGKSISGLVKIKGNKISFKKNKSSKKVNYNYENVAMVTYLDKDNNEHKYEYIKLTYKKKPQLMLIQIDGFLKLYTESNFTFSGGAGTGGFGTAAGAGSFSGGSTYYIKRENEKFATYYVAFGYIPKNKFKKVVRDYFKDCKSLLNKINNNEFKKKHYVEIVEYYNTNCR